MLEVLSEPAEVVEERIKLNKEIEIFRNAQKIIKRDPEYNCNHIIVCHNISYKYLKKKTRNPQGKQIRRRRRNKNKLRLPNRQLSNNKNRVIKMLRLMLLWRNQYRNQMIQQLNLIRVILLNKINNKMDYLNNNNHNSNSHNNNKQLHKLNQIAIPQMLRNHNQINH